MLAGFNDDIINSFKIIRFLKIFIISIVFKNAIRTGFNYDVMTRFENGIRGFKTDMSLILKLGYYAVFEDNFNGIVKAGYDTKLIKSPK